MYTIVHIIFENPVLSHKPTNGNCRLVNETLLDIYSRLLVTTLGPV